MSDAALSSDSLAEALGRSAMFGGRQGAFTETPQRTRAALRILFHPALTRARMAMARLGPGRVAFSEFRALRLDDPTLSTAEVMSYIGRRQAMRCRLACDRQAWAAPLADRALFHQLAAGAGLPIPALLAAYAPGQRGFAVAPLRDREALGVLLRQPSTYPLLADPLDRNVPGLSFQELHPQGLRLPGGTLMPLEVAEGRLADGPGWLLLRRPQAHVALRSAYGEDSLPVVHALMLAGEDLEEPQLLSATLVARLPHGEQLASALDEQGRIRRTLRGSGRSAHAIIRHPETDALLAGRGMPYWQATVALLQRAAAVFAPYRVQAWEAAITDEGPILLGLAGGEETWLHQAARRQGLLTEDFLRHLRRHGGGPLSVFQRMRRSFPIS